MSAVTALALGVAIASAVVGFLLSRGRRLNQGPGLAETLDRFGHLDRRPGHVAAFQPCQSCGLATLGVDLHVVVVHRDPASTVAWCVDCCSTRIWPSHQPEPPKPF